MRQIAAIVITLGVGCGVAHDPSADAAVGDDGPRADHDAAGGRWTVSYSPTARDSVTKVQLYAAADDMLTDIASWPAAGDSWFDHVMSTTHTDHVMRAGANAQAAFGIAIADDIVLDVMVSQTDDPMSVAGATIVFQPSRLCYGPVSDATTVVFTFSCTGSATASGADAQVSAGSDSGSRACQVGTADGEGTHVVSDDRTSTVTVHVGPDGMACATDVVVRADAGPLSLDTSASQSTFTGTVRIHAN